MIGQERAGQRQLVTTKQNRFQTGQMVRLI